MKDKKQNGFRAYFELFSILLLGFAVLFWQILKTVCAFVSVSENVAWWIGTGCTILCTVALGIFVITRKTRVQKMKTWIWITNHIAAIDLWYVIPILFLISLKATIVNSMQDLKDIVSVSWTILGIIIAIFGIWYILIPKYLKNKQPKFNEYPEKHEWQKMYDKGEYFEKVSVFFLPSVWVGITLVLLVVATNAVYLTTKGVSLLSQTLVRFSFYFCTNTILLIFFDILKTFKDEKGSLLEVAYISNEDIEKQAKIEAERDALLKILSLIDKVPSIHEETKKELMDAVAVYYNTYEDE